MSLEYWSLELDAGGEGDSILPFPFPSDWDSLHDIAVVKSLSISNASSGFDIAFRADDLPGASVINGLYEFYSIPAGYSPYSDTLFIPWVVTEGYFYVWHTEINAGVRLILEVQRISSSTDSDSALTTFGVAIFTTPLTKLELV